MHTTVLWTVHIVRWHIRNICPIEYYDSIASQIVKGYSECLLLQKDDTQTKAMNYIRAFNNNAGHEHFFLHRPIVPKLNKENTKAFSKNKCNNAECNLAMSGTMKWRMCVSYTLSHEYRVARYRYSRLLFTSEDRLCANLRVQWQKTNMTSQYQYFAFAWRHRSIVVTSQCSVRKGRPWQQWRNERSVMVLSGFVCSWHRIACKK